jgi:hypothetical protein
MLQTAKRAFPMAYDRATFKNRVMEKIDGALVECYKAALAELNGQTKWVQHWRNEVERLLFIELHTVLVRPIKGRWDRRRAISEVIAELRAADAGYRRVAEGAIKRYYGLKRIGKRLPDEVTGEFYAMVDQAIDEGPQGEPIPSNAE